MKPRQFRREPHRTGDGTSQDYRLRCGTCGCFGTLGGAFQFGAATAADVVPKKFAAKGWFVGKRQNGADDRCPACVNREAEARRKKLHIVPAEEVLPVTHPKPQSIAFPIKVETAQPPRSMTRDERRLIWAKLEEVYLDERSGFTAGWTDERVAVDLGVPRAWISTIREENFGPDHGVEVEKALNSANDLAVEIADLDRDMAALKARGQEIAKKAEAIGRALKRIDSVRGAA